MVRSYIPSLNFSPSAQEKADLWRSALEERLLSSNDSSMIRAHISKYRSLMPSLSLLFSVLESFHLSGRLPSELSESSVDLACTWCVKLESHLRKLYENTSHSKNQSATVLAEKIKGGMVVDGQRLREINRRNWVGLRSADELEEAIAILKAHNWVRVETAQTLGGPSECLRINPALVLEVAR